MGVGNRLEPIVVRSAQKQPNPHRATRATLMRAVGPEDKGLIPPAPKSRSREGGDMDALCPFQRSDLSPGKKHLTTTRLPTCSFRQLPRLPLISARSVGTEGGSKVSP